MIAGGDVVFTPDPGYAGPASFTYTISDGAGGSDTATVVLSVGASNNPPVANDDGPVAVTEDTPVSGNVLTDGTPDSDPDGNPLAVTGFTVAGVAGSFAPGASATIPGVGSLSIAANGAYTFAPASNYNGPVPVATYTISDGLGGSDSATLTFANVSAVNDAPLAVADTNSVPINTPISGNVITNDTDVEGNVLSVTEFTVTGVAGTFVAGATATIPGVGTLVINANGTYTFNPAANYAGAMPVATYTISDGQGAPNTASATLTLTMGSNNPPVANDDGPVAVTEDTPVSGNVLTDGTPDSDPDGNPLAVTGFTVAGVAGSFAPGASATIPGVGSLSIAANGAYTFAPASNYNGPVPVATYTISDGLGGSDSATLTFANVSAVNDAPLAVADTNSVPINTPISGNVITNDTDVEGNVLSVTEFTVTGVAGTFVAGTTATIPGVGTLVINANGTYTFNPAANYAGAIPMATYTITNGAGAPNTASATLTLTMGSDNPPVAKCATARWPSPKTRRSAATCSPTAPLTATQTVTRWP